MGRLFTRDLDELRKELGYGKRLNLNQVRIFMDPDEYERDGQAYLDSMVEIVRTCYECGYGVMPVIWNGNRQLPRILEPSYWEEKGDAYMIALVNAMKDEPGLFIWDIMNEPGCNGWIAEAPEEEKQARWDKLYAFIKHMCELIKKVDPINAITVGHTNPDEIGPCYEYVDVISFHDYSPTRASVEENFAHAAQIGAKCGKPVLQTENGCISRANPYDVTLQACQRHNMGWYLFELMIKGFWDSIHGIFYPDGTVRDPSIAAAIVGCFRNRGDNQVMPRPNREGYGDRALADIRTALNEYNGNFFAYQKGSTEELLEACEMAANLLEASEMVPMVNGPMVKILKWRSMEQPPQDEIREFAYGLARKLQEACQII